MFRIKTFTLLILLVALPALLFAQQQSQTPQSGQAQSQADQTGSQQGAAGSQGQMATGNAVRLDQLIGTSIASQDNSMKGTIQDFVLTEKGEVRYVVVSMMGGGAGTSTQPSTSGAQAPAAGTTQGQTAQAGQAYLVPIDQVSFSGGQAMLQTSGSQISSLQSMQGSTLPSSIATEAGVKHVLASQLMDATVVGQQGMEIGRLQGTMMDTQAKRILYFAVAPAGTLGLGQALYAVPTSAVSQINPDQRQIMLNVSASQVGQYQGFSQDNWPQQVSGGPSTQK